jgi:hypothetical protein
MSLRDRLKKIDSHSSVSTEFRVYTVQGAVLSVVTVALILYLVISEAYFNFQVTIQQRVHVNATSARGLEMEFDISLHSVKCSELSIDAQDPTGQSQSLHLDTNHHVWKHRVEMQPHTGAVKRVLAERQRIELGSTLLNLEAVVGRIDENAAAVQNLTKSAITVEQVGLPDSGCGSCYGAGEVGECCNSCDDVQRAYKIKGWALTDLSIVTQCES